MVQNILYNQIYNIQSNISYSLQNTASAIHSAITIPMWFPLQVSIIRSLSRQWASSVSGEDYMGWSQLKPFALFEILLLVVQFLYSVLDWTPYSLPPMLVWLTQGDIHTFKGLREKHLYHRLINSTVDSFLSKTKAILWSPFCWD